MSSRRFDIEAQRAVNGAAHRYGFGSRRNLVFEPGIVQRYQDVAVTMARDFAPYAVSYRSRRWYVHLTRAVFVAWRRGRPVGMRIDTRCGAALVTAQLRTEVLEPLCRRCVAAAPERYPRVTVIVHVEEAR